MPALEIQVARALAAGADLIELRIDLIGDIPAVERLLAAPRTVPFVLTVRSAAEGGAWDAPDDERIALIERLGLLMPGYIDVELATFERSANLRQKLGLVSELTTASSLAAAAACRARNRLILSAHDFRATPTDLQRVMDRFPISPVIIGKAAFMTRDANDALRILIELQRLASRRPMAMIGMGEAGIPTRVLARKFGAFLSFAAIDEEAASAPGQLSPAQMRNLFRWDSIGPDTTVYGIVGWPVSHSKSPLVHNAGMSRANVNGIYLPWPVAPGYESFAQFMDTLAGAPQLDIRGLSVTIPHKEHAYRWLIERGAPLSDLAQRSGAVNTLSLRGDVWHGDNTDVVALRELLASARAARRVLIVGAGGVARAAAAAVSERDVVIVNRTNDRAKALAAEFGCDAGDWESRGDIEADVVIQCTSMGMQPNTNESPLPRGALRSDMTIIETVYAPRITRLMHDAIARGCRVVSGVEMFIAQAEAQFRLWHGARPPAGLFGRLLNVEP